MGKKGGKIKTRFIKEPPTETNNLGKTEIEAFAKIDYPLFSFKYLQEHSIKKCKDGKFFFDFLMRLKGLSELGWKEIGVAGRHQYGMEKLPREEIKPSIPAFVTKEVPLFVFRAKGNNLPFVGVRQGKIFHVIFIETEFGDIYDHE